MSRSPKDPADDDPVPWEEEDLHRFAFRAARRSTGLPPKLNEVRRKGGFDPLVRIERAPETPRPRSEAPRSPRPVTPAITGQTALLALLPDGPRLELEETLRGQGVATVATDSVGAALTAVADRRPTFVFTSIEFAPLHGASLIAALKACPDHRSVPLVVLTPQDPLLLDLSVYQPDGVVATDRRLSRSVVAFLNEMRVRRRDLVGPGASPWVQIQGRILLADGSVLAQRIIGKGLHAAGADVTIVENAAELMLALAAREFDLVLLDLGLPSADGVEVVPFIRAVAADVPLLGLGGTPDPAEPSELDAHLPKPVRRPQLLDLCNRLLRRRSRASA